MDAKDGQAIDRSYSEIEALDGEVLNKAVGLLQSRKVFMEEEVALVQMYPRTEKRWWKLVDLLKRRGTKGFGVLLDALFAAHQHDLVRSLDPERRYPDCHRVCPDCGFAAPPPNKVPKMDT